MTAVLSHEIRNALGSIKGYTQWIIEKMEGSDPNKAGLALVLKGTERIESLVNDLLLYSREEAYHLALLEVDQVIQEVIASEILLRETKIETQIEPGSKVFADKDKLYRVLLNGIQNAMQAMGESPSLQIQVESKGKWTEIRLEDSGTGTAGEEPSKLFEPFYTTKTTGTGLGLTYSKKVIEGMGGEIDLFNRENAKGAVLIIRLPKAERT
jgi:signal transduction histidine kinase